MWLSISYYDCNDHSEKKVVYCFPGADRVTLGYRAVFSDAPWACGGIGLLLLRSALSICICITAGCVFTRLMSVVDANSNLTSHYGMAFILERGNLKQGWITKSKQSTPF